ncbi:MAG: NAD(P)H-dependent glycerol-3-phosphate dehydrogenase [Sulfurovaceae bacterium]|nr:NAD(P)H-dependent glycerol-3-phosphate dehydrogenase [Sulfurovaceae bacterium]MDD5548650.1 NAD(P)H-dependent glycerol-3-phosphate dehydrogenase [Sulfurovaceae bacterium]
MKIAIIGAGKWGQALFHAFKEKNECVITSRKHRDIDGFVSLDTALQCPYLVITIPAQEARKWMEENFKDNGQSILVAAKGIEIKSGAFLNEVYESFIDGDRLAFLSGPSFSSEVEKSLPTALVVSSKNENLSKQFSKALPDFIKGYISSDIVGEEVAGAYKNVIAIAGGVSDGLELGNNARAALLARGLVEMSRFGQAYGAKSETFLSLGGAGDLFLTASSTLSRNYRVGFMLSQGKSLEDILKELGEVAEGVATAKALYDIAIKNDIYLPIAKQVYDMLFMGKNPRESVKDLLS